MSILLNTVVTGIAIGSVYGLIAIGYTVAFNATRVFNLAQGDLVMVGVMLAYVLLNVEHLPELLVLLIVVAGVVAVTLVEERVAVYPFLRRSREGIGWFISTLAFALVVETLAFNLYGNRPPLPVRSPLPVANLNFGPVHISPRLVFPVGILLLILVALELFYRRTWLGLSMRSMAEDRELARMRGVNVSSMSALAFAISGAIAGLAGFVIAPITLANTSIGIDYSLKGFVALAIGGFGSLRGAVVGALVLGVSEQIFDAYVSSTYEIVVGLMLLLVVLVVRPLGIFGTSVRRV